MRSLSSVDLQFYEHNHYESLKAFQLPSEQEQFTALPIGMLEVSDVRFPMVILADSEPVGFFVLHSGDKVKEYSDNPSAILLSALSINHAQQGKGYAKLGMELLKSFVQRQFPKYNEIVLAVNKRNLPAQSLYEKINFKDTGRRRMGINGEQFIYSLSLN